MRMYCFCLTNINPVDVERLRAGVDAVGVGAGRRFKRPHEVGPAVGHRGTRVDDPAERFVAEQAADVVEIRVAFDQFAGAAAAAGG